MSRIIESLSESDEIKVNELKIGTLAWFKYNKENHLVLRTWDGMVSLSDPEATWSWSEENPICGEQMCRPCPPGFCVTIEQE